jgi:hypothetical protein
MNDSLTSLEIKVLEKMYLREIEILKFKLLSGAFLKEVRKQRNKIIELALAIHNKNCNGGSGDSISMEELSE